MSKVEELNKLALKLTGSNPYKKTIKESLESIATYLAGENVEVENIEDAIKKCTEYYSGGGGGFPPDWSEIGYTDTPSSVIDSFNYAKQIYDNWDSSVTSMKDMFDSDLNLKIMPLVDTSNVTTMESAFNYCTHLESIPLLDTSKVESFYGTFSGTNLKTIPPINTESATYMRDMFSGCQHLVSVPLLSTDNVDSMNGMFRGCGNLVTIPCFSTMVVTNMQDFVSGCDSLSDESLNNILCMCEGATEIPEETRKTSYIGLSGEYASRLPSLQYYQSFIDAGWVVNS